MATHSSPARLDPTDRNRVWCYDDLAAIPDDRNRYEIIDGELLVSPAPRVTHQTIVKHLLLLLHHVLERPGHATVFAAPLDVVLGPRRVVQPDLVVLRSARRSQLTDLGFMGAPDLVVEVLSPSTAKVDRGRKQALYGEVGIGEYWIVDSAKMTLEVLTPDAAGVMQLRGTYGASDTAHSPTFGFTFAVADVFAD